jgi:hypothetical protein
VRMTKWGYPIMEDSTEGMTSPVRCTHCRRVYDLGTVTVTARYLDCSCWNSPCCNRSVDDRDEFWKSRPDIEPLT